MKRMQLKRTKKSRVGLVAALLGVALLGLTSAVTLGAVGFNATITNPTNTYSSGTLLLQEGSGTAACVSSGTDTINAANTNSACGINDFGTTANAAPGIVTTAAIPVSNVGTVAGSTLTITPAATCAVTANSATTPYSGADTTGFCGKVDVTIQNDSTTSPSCVYPAGTGACPAPSSTYTLATLAGHAPLSGSGLGASGSSTGTGSYTVSLELDSSATNADQGLSATVPLTWQLSQ